MWQKKTSVVFVGAMYGLAMLVLAIYLSGFGEGWCAGVLPSPLAGIGVMLTCVLWIYRTRLWAPLLLLPLVMTMLTGDLLLLSGASVLPERLARVRDSEGPAFICWMILWIAWQVAAIGCAIVVIWHRVAGKSQLSMRSLPR